MSRAVAGTLKRGFKPTDVEPSADQTRQARAAAIAEIQRVHLCGATKAGHILAGMRLGMFMSRPAPDVYACTVCQGWRERTIVFRAVILEDWIAAYAVCDRCEARQSGDEIQRLVVNRMKRVEVEEEQDGH